MDRFIDTQTSRLFSDGKKDCESIPYEYKGVTFSDGNVKQEVLERLPEWEARPDDVYVVSFPKAGTTWTQEIMYLALNKADVEKAKKTHTMLRVPYLEANISRPELNFISKPLKSLLLLWCLIKVLVRIILHCIKQRRKPLGVTPYNLAKMLPSPRLLKSHLPVQLLPQDILEKKAKIVYVARNPKDVAVSYYKFHQWQPMLPNYDSWDKYIDDYMTGKVTYGKWYDHNLGYWRRRNEDNILFMKYEDMKKDEKAAVKRICEFLGYHYSDRILNRITEHSSFSSMKTNPMTNPDSLTTQKDNHSFMRKGQVGDWRNYFTDAQNEAFDAIYDEKLRGTGLDFDFN